MLLLVPLYNESHTNSIVSKMVVYWGVNSLNRRRAQNDQNNSHSGHLNIN